MITDDDILIDDLDIPDEVLSLTGERSYTIDQLLRAIPQIDVIREYLIVHGDDFIEMREVKRYSLDFHKRKRDYLFSPHDFARLFGKGAKEVYSLLTRNGYAESVGKQIRLKTKFFVTTVDDFDLGKSKKFERTVFNGLDKLLKRRIAKKTDEKGGWKSPETYQLYDKRAQIVPPVRNSSKDYIFRIGNKFLYIDFYYIPSQELLELIQLRLTLIYQEQMENFFQIISSFSIDRDSWQRGQNRKDKFKELVESLFSEAWNHFDLEQASLQIYCRDGNYSFARGTYSCRFDEAGESTWSYREEIDELPPVFNLSREFLARNVQLVYSQFTGESITMDLYMKSRSVNNIDPRIGVLLHNFLRLLRDSISRVIETVVSIIQMEEANKELKRHLFLESLRVKCSGHGENIHRIIIESLSIIKWIFQIKDAYLYSGNEDFIKMLSIYSNFDDGAASNYDVISAPVPEDEKRERNLLEVRILEQIGEELIIYLKMPVKGEPGENYLQGTVIEKAVMDTIEQYDLTWPERGLEFLLPWSLSSNSGIVTNEIIDQLSQEREWLGDISAPQFADRVVRSFSLFFELTASLNDNLESGVTSMRGSRDRLTGLYNRQTFSRKLNMLFDEQKSFGLMFMDMDTFKIYNDAVSHSFGDKLLIQLSNILLESKINLGRYSLAGRFGGDEFCFAMEGDDFDFFEKESCRIFRAITERDLATRFHLEDRQEKGDFDINMISFLHRLLRPDVGGVRGAGSDFVEEKGLLPGDRLVKLYVYYQREINGNDTLDETALDKDGIIDFFVETIFNKVLRNKIFSSIDAEVDLIIRQFITLQMKDLTTDDIRSEIIRKLGKKEIFRPIRIRISTGLAHSGEDRLRSVSSIFNSADARAYMAKHNGRNGLFGLNSHRLI